MSTKIKVVISVILVMIAFSIFVYERQNLTKLAPQSTMAIESPSLAGWGDGKKIWEMKAASIVASENNTKVLNNVFDGCFLNQDKKQAVFSAKEAIYENETGKINFLKGLKLKTKGGTEIAADSAVWEPEEQSITTDGDVYVKTKNFALIGQSVVVKDNFNNVAIVGNTQVNFDKDLQLTADGARYEEEAKQLNLFGHATLIAYNPNMQKTKVVASKLQLMSDTNQVLAPEEADIEIPGFKVKAYQAMYDKGNHILQINGAVGTTSKGDTFSALNTVANIDDGSVKAEKALMAFKKVETTNNTGETLTSDHVVLNMDALQSDGGSVLKATGIQINRADSNKITANRAEIATFARSINLSGNVIVVLDAETSLVSDQVKYDWEKSIFETQSKTVMQYSSSGAVINADKVLVDWRANKISFTNEVSLTVKNGHSITAQSALYYPQTKLLVLTGNVKTSRTDIQLRPTDKITINIATGDMEIANGEQQINSIRFL